MSIQDFASIELWVGNARHTSSYLTHAFGFVVTELIGGLPHDRISYVLEQGGIRLTVTGATCRDSPVADFVRRHGDGVRDITLTADQAEVDGIVPGFGDTVHTLVSGSPVAHPKSTGSVGLDRIDHVAVSVDAGSRSEVVAQYETGLGFVGVGDPVEYVDIGISSFVMSAVRASAGGATFVFAEPTDGPSQIRDFLSEYGGAGVHHIAFQTSDVIATARALKSRGVEILSVPSVYYQEARDRLSGLDQPWADLEELGILVASDHGGLLRQAFTEPIGDRPTLYFEIIERVGATGFGADNIRALYHAVVLQQARA
jgi:4-hydroxyphenylpyruvate dioxygenase